MKCPFCAEAIQDAAILCRFCGAKKFHQNWLPPPPPVYETPAKKQAPKGTFTFKTSAVLFIASGVFEVFALRNDVPLFGAMRGGAIAGLYHLIYIGLFVAIGIALWRGAAWGYRVVLGGVGFYIFDKLLYLLDTGAREAELAQQTAGYGDIFRIVDKGSINMVVTVSVLTIVACWVGFGVFVYFRRDYFRN